MPANFSFDSYRSGVMPKLEVPTRLGGRSRSERTDRKSTRLNSSHSQISYAVFCLNKIKSPSPSPARPPLSSSSSRYFLPVTDPSSGSLAPIGFSLQPKHHVLVRSTSIFQFSSHTT